MSVSVVSSAVSVGGRVTSFSVSQIMCLCDACVWFLEGLLRLPRSHRLGTAYALSTASMAQLHDRRGGNLFWSVDLPGNA